MEQYKDCILIPISQIDSSGRITAERSDETLEDIQELAEGILEDGLLQPIVVEKIDDGYKLIAGGRRLTAFSLLSKTETEKDFSVIPARLLDTLSPAVRIKLEWEENHKRKDPDWRMNCIHVAAFHKASSREALRNGKKWTQAATGKVMGYEQGSVSALMLVAKELQAENPLVTEAESFQDAIKNLLKVKNEEAQAELLRRLKAKKVEASLSVPKDSEPHEVSVTSEAPSLSTVEMSPATKAEESKLTNDDVLGMYTEGDALEMLPKLHSAIGIHHIICDPPYGIDMKNLVSDSVENIEDTHDVKDNLDMLPAFLKVAFDNIREDGFLCMWYDLDHHEKIHNWASMIGWKVQRWPLVWCKTSPCRNSQPQYNFTKSTEVCYIMRRSSKSTLKQKVTQGYVMAGSASTPSHPFVKPFEVWKKLIEAVSSKGQNIVDPFAGEGSMLAAGVTLGRSPHGIEIDSKHIASGVHYVKEQINKNNNDEFFSEPTF